LQNHGTAEGSIGGGLGDAETDLDGLQTGAGDGKATAGGGGDRSGGARLGGLGNGAQGGAGGPLREKTPGKW